MLLQFLSKKEAALCDIYLFVYWSFPSSFTLSRKIKARPYLFLRVRCFRKGSKKIFRLRTSIAF